MIKKSKNIKIIDDTESTKGAETISISNVNYLDDYILEIYFDDGVIQKIDFAPFLTSSPHPEVQKYLNVILFKRYTLDEGDLYWGDYDLIFPITDLYTNNIQTYIPPKKNIFNSTTDNQIGIQLLYHYWLHNYEEEKNIRGIIEIDSYLKSKLHSIFDRALKIIHNLNKEPIISIFNLLSKNEKLSTNEILNQINIDKESFNNEINFVRQAKIFLCYRKDNIDYWELNDKCISSLLDLSSEPFIEKAIEVELEKNRLS